jgi:RNA polymerase sigma-70 factor (ECF subfamily)
VNDRARAVAGSAAASVDPDLAAVRAAQRDRSAFAWLYRRYLDRVYAYAFYRLGDHHDAEDATERVFLQAMRALPTFDERGASFRAWLFTIAHHTVANVHRGRARSRSVAMPDGFDWPAPDSDPAGVVGRADELRAVLRALGRLSEERQQVILLRFVEGLSSAETAEVLGRSPAAVRVLLHRALRDLSRHVAR